MTDTRAKAEELARRPYLIVTSVDMTTEGQPIYFARVLEIEGCFGQGKTRDKAIEDLRLAMVDLIESLLKDGLPVPEPTKLTDLTSGPTTQGVFTFTVAGRELQPKQSEVQRRNAYVLSVIEE